jgi:dimethylargininase
VPRALVRPPGDSFVKALSNHPERDTIDPERARLQHAAYTSALERLGFEVAVLPIEEDLPDSCFVQDVALVIGGRALVCRPGEQSRQPEAERIEQALRSLVRSMERVAAPATLEGGDVFLLDGRVIVGRSHRTNEEGIRALERFASPVAQVVEAQVPEPYLHLLSGVALADDVAVGAEAVVDQPAFDGFDRLIVPDDEAVGCNFVRNGRDLLMAAGYPRIQGFLEDRGFHVHTLDLSEFRKAEGGPTSPY